MKVSGGPDSMFHREIKNQCSFWTARQSIPCLLSSILIEQYEKTTRAQMWDHKFGKFPETVAIRTEGKWRICSQYLPSFSVTTPSLCITAWPSTDNVQSRLFYIYIYIYWRSGCGEGVFLEYRINLSLTYVNDFEDMVLVADRAAYVYPSIDRV